jgi:dihydroorotate dehydrogenase (fumarate)
MIDLSTAYLGLKLRTPLVPSASPLAHELDSVRRLEDAGASAIIFHSIFEETAASGLEYVPARPALEHYISNVSKAKKAVSVPLISSLCGLTADGWVSYAQQLEQAGADAIELNLYQVPSQADIPGADLEKAYVDIVRSVKWAVKIPVAAKLTPFFTSMTNMAKQFDQAGADGLVLFNRFYQPDINLEALEMEPNVLLSTPPALRLPLTWIGILFGRIKANLAASGGVHSPEDIVKLVLAGADVTMVCSALLRHGISYLRDLENGLRQWLEKHECKSVQSIKGTLSQIRCPDPAVFERAQYINAVKGMKNVVLTGREAWRILSSE